MTRTYLTIAAAIAAGVAVPASAATVTYTTEAEFLAATSATAVDGYDDLSGGGRLDSSLTRAAGSYAYTVSAAGDLYVAGTTADPSLSTADREDVVTFSGFAADVGAIGGLFVGANASGGFQRGTLVLTLLTADGSVSETLIDVSRDNFVGFVTTSAITSLTLTATQNARAWVWPSVDKLTLGKAGAIAAVVPEPATWAMMLLGFGMMGASIRYRRRDTRIVYA